jgi:hypothetical protein
MAWAQEMEVEEEASPKFVLSPFCLEKRSENLMGSDTNCTRTALVVTQ